MKIFQERIWPRMIRWLTPKRMLRITRAGWQFIGLTLVVGMAAVNTANNLLYLIFGLMLSFITTSGILSELMLRKIRLNRRFPKHLFAGQAAPVALEVTNGKQHVTSLSLLIEDLSQAAVPEHRRYLLRIAPQQTQTVTYPVTFPQRGLYRPGKLRISTRYPFGFFLKSAMFAETDDVLIYPALTPLSASDRAAFSPQAGDSGVRRKGGGQEFHGIRDYLPGDNRRQIHWKSTARTSKFMMKEFEEEQKKQIVLLLDISPPSQTAAFSAQIEQAISLAASYAAYFLRQDYAVQLATPTETTPSGKGDRHLFLLLRMLALLQPARGQDTPQFDASAAAKIRRAVMSILIALNPAYEQQAGRFSKIIIIKNAEGRLP